MLVKLERFDGKAIYVNPEQVVYVDPAERRLADQTEYSFVYLHDMNNAVQVKGSPEAINEMLDSASGATLLSQDTFQQHATTDFTFPRSMVSDWQAKYGITEEGDVVPDDIDPSTEADWENEARKEPTGDEGWLGEDKTGELPGQTSIDDVEGDH